MALIFQLFLIWEGKTHASCKDLQIGKAVLQIGGENLKSGMWTLEHSSMELQKKKDVSFLLERWAGEKGEATFTGLEPHHLHWYHPGSPASPPDPDASSLTSRSLLTQQPE